MKKSSFSPREYLEQMPLDEHVKAKDGAFHIPIGALEEAMDFFEWGTRNFHWELYKDGYANLCVAASLELVLSYLDDEGNRMSRCFVGACNFSLASLSPIPHFLATAKSECVKNAASAAGRRFGRGLNADVGHERFMEAPVEKVKAKIKPDHKIVAQFKAAVERGDEAAITLISNIYDVNTSDHGN